MIPYETREKCFRWERIISFETTTVSVTDTLRAADPPSSHIQGCFPVQHVFMNVVPFLKGGSVLDVKPSEL